MPFATPTSLSVMVATLGLALFIMAIFALSLLMPGPIRSRAKRDDGRSQNRWDGLALLGLCLAVATVAQWTGTGLALAARHFWALLIGANLLAWPGSLALFLIGRSSPPPRLADFFFGRERNPSLCGLDLKMFSYRPSLIGLAMTNLAFASLQWESNGRISLAMALYQCFTLAYIANYFQFEHGMRFTWDIMEERFGWMLVWGDYVLVPFFYCLPGIYIFLRPDPLPVAAVPVLTALYAFGFWLFRGANGQKHRFKSKPAAPIWGRRPKSLGGRLLVSGFWGIGRKLNYTGELLMYLAWTLLCGFHTLVPYLLPGWLLGLLVQRAARDDRRCRAKYGALWEEYCQHVRFRMFPFLY